MAATLDSGSFQGSVTFTAPEGPVKGKRMSNPATRAQLGWQPKYPSYAGEPASGPGTVPLPGWNGLWEQLQLWGFWRK